MSSSVSPRDVLRHCALPSPACCVTYSSLVSVQPRLIDCITHSSCPTTLHRRQQRGFVVSLGAALDGGCSSAWDQWPLPHCVLCNVGVTESLHYTTDFRLFFFHFPFKQSFFFYLRDAFEVWFSPHRLYVSVTAAMSSLRMTFKKLHFSCLVDGLFMWRFFLHNAFICGGFKCKTIC